MDSGPVLLKNKKLDHKANSWDLLSARAQLKKKMTLSQEIAGKMATVL